MLVPDFSQLLISSPTPPCVRLAPTPSGYLHIGNGVNFVLNWLVARAQPDGRVLLRIDDLDADRKRPEYVQDVFETLDWLGLDWDEGPRSPDDFEKNWTQHLRIPSYEQLLQVLREKGLLFACAKSRRELAVFAPAYPEVFRSQHIPLETPDVAWRVMTPAGFPLPDFVVRRRDGIPAYQIGSLADDVQFGVTHIVRGADLEASTQAQQYLAERAGLTAFLEVKVWHHPLLLDADGNKLSKSAGAASLKAMREAGVSPQIVYRQVAKMLGINGAVPSLGELLLSLAALR